MTIDDQLQREQDDLARAELRRIFSQLKPPTNTPLEAFGPWAPYVGPLRQAFDERGLKAAQEVFVAFIRLHRPLGLLYSSDAALPEAERPRSAQGKAGEVRQESLRGAILAAIRELAELGEVSSTTAIARHLHRDKSNVTHDLAGLIQAGQVVKGQRDGRVVPYFLVE